MKITDAAWVKLTWIYQNDFFTYENVGRVVCSSKGQSIRFTLRESKENDGDIEVAVNEKRGVTVFTADCFDDPHIETDLRKFTSPDELVYFFEDEYGHGFFRIGV